MKKLFLYITLSTLIFTAFSQVEEINGKKYLLPYAISSQGCIPFDSSDSLYFTQYEMFGFDFYSTLSGCNFYNIAQCFHTDDSLKIIGIAGYMKVVPNALIINNYLGIADSSFNIIEEKVLANSLINNSNLYPYYELLFDNPKKVIGDFYVITVFARPHYYWKDGAMYEDSLNAEKYNWNGPYETIFHSMQHVIEIPAILSKKRCDRQKLMIKNYVYFTTDPSDIGFSSSYESDWTDFSDEFIGFLNNVLGLYIYPLIGEDENDTVSSIESVQVENFTYVFPNPASDKVTIQSSFKIHNMEIFNEQAQKVFESKPNGYNTTINISQYPKGIYTIKIATISGTANKKIAVQ